jgi:cobalt-precorrin 5A hydrolase
MRVAVTALTVGGIETARCLVSFFPEMILYVPEKYSELSDANKFDDFNGHVVSIFEKYDCHVFIMATGIVVRKIAPLIKSKLTDPSVIVMDEKGHNVISLLSGHLGGGNEMVLDICRKFGGNPVITTSSDVNKKPSVDMFAKKRNLVIDSMEMAKVVTAKIVNGEKVGLIGIKDTEFDSDDLANIDDYEEGFSGYIHVSNKLIEERNDTALLIKKNIVMGFGCRRGKSSSEIKDMIFALMEERGYNPRALSVIVSIDLKSDEKGLLEFAKEYDIELEFYSSDQLIAYENKFPKSEFVKKTVGVGNVCDTSAYRRVGDTGKKIGETSRKNGITLSMWEE